MRNLVIALVFLLPMGRVTYAQSQQQELYATALRAFDDGFHDVAVRYLEQFLQDYPQDPKTIQAKFLLAQCYFFKNRLPEALNLFNSLTGSYDNKELLLWWLGEVYLKIPDYPKAQEEYQQLLDSYPHSVYLPQVYYSLGWSYFDQKQYNQAREFFDQLAAKFPKHQLSEDAMLKSAQCSYDVGDYRGALTRFIKFLVRYPQSEHQTEIYLNMADAYYYLEDYENAKTYYDKVLQTPNTKMALIAYAGEVWSYLKLKDLKKAEKILQEAQAFNKVKNLPDDDLLLVQANVFSEKGDYQAALGVYTTLIKNFPRGPHYLEAHLGRANTNFILKRFKEALGDYSFVIDQSGNEELSLKANLGLAWTYAKLNNLPLAQKRFQSIIEHTDKVDVKINTMVQMADVLADADKTQEAVRIYDNVIRSYPDDSMADYVQKRQAIALLKMGKIQTAKVAFENLQTNFPKSPYLEDVNYYLGLVAFKVGDWKTASIKMEGFLKELSHPSDFTAEANYILGLSYLNLQQSEDALKIFQKILRLYPDNLTVAENSEMGIAKCQYELGQAKEAIKRFKLIIYKYPKTEVEYEALLWLAQYYLKSVDYAQTADFYQQIVDRFPDHAGIDEVHYEMGQVYEIQGMYDQALVQYKTISPHGELDTKAKLAIAGIFAKEFDMTKAAQAYESIAMTSPELGREAYLKLAQLYRNNQSYEKEMACYQKALQLPATKDQVSDPELLFDIADTYDVMGRWDNAVGNYLKIPAQYPHQLDWIVKAYLRVAKIFEDRKDWGGARVTYQKIIQLNTEESKFAQERLDVINSNGGNKK